MHSPDVNSHSQAMAWRSYLSVHATPAAQAANTGFEPIPKRLATCLRRSGYSVVPQARVCYLRVFSRRRGDGTLEVMKLGQMLIRDNRLTEEQLQQVLANQARDGGRLGTVMVEMGLIDLDTLTVYLGLELGIPIATRATLDRAKRTAVRLLTPQQALRYRCVPIVVQDRHLIAAVDDPHDIQSLDELSRITGYRLLPRVAPEMRIYYYIERYFGVPRPGRFARYGDEPVSASQPDLPAPPLPGLPPPTENPVPQGPRKQPSISRMPRITNQELRLAHQELTHEAEKLVTKLDADEADGAEQAPRTELNSLAKAPPLEVEIPDVYEPLDMETAIQAMKDATRRGDIVDALMAYAVGLFDTAILCIIRDNMAFGWKASGPTIDHERVETLLIPLDMPSMFQIAMHNDNFFHAAPFPATLHTYLYKVLRCSPPDFATIAVISIGRRVVNLIYGHRAERAPLSDAEIENLKYACKAASTSYVRLIAAAKRTAPEMGAQDD